MLKKLSSRKFWMALLSVITGILIMFGVDDSVVQIVSSIGLIVIPTLTYIIIEGKIDIAGIKKIIDTVENVVNVIEKDNSQNNSSSELYVTEAEWMKVKEATESYTNIVSHLDKSQN